MRLLCIADHVDPLIYSNGLKERYGKVDMVLSAGDLTLGYYDFIISTSEQAALFRLRQPSPGEPRASSASPAIHSPGDDRHALGKGRRGDMHRGKGGPGARGSSSRVSGGSIWYNGGENQFTDFTMFLTMLRLVPGMLWHRIFHGRFLDVLVTHAPPYGINDLPDPCHTGFRVFLWFMRTFKPRYLVHGHVHLYDRNAAREARYESTIIINAYDHIVIDLESTP